MAPRASKGFKTFTLYIEGVNANNIPLDDIGWYLIDLAAIIGKENAPRIQNVRNGSLRLATKIQDRDEDDVRARLLLIKSDDAPQDLIASQRNISERLGRHKARRATLLDPSQNNVLEFPVVRPAMEIYDIPRISQAGELQGKIIRIGGKNEDVAVDIEDVDGHVYKCRAKRNIASRLAKEMFFPTVRVFGEGGWVRKDEGWDIDGFKIFDYELLDDASLETAIAEIRGTFEGLKDIADPFNVLDGIRNGVLQ